MKLLFRALMALVIVIGLFLRFMLLEETGGDYNTYKDAVVEFDQGINPYIKAVESFKNNTGEHGYAYFPTLLYILWGIWKISNLFETVIPSVFLWKIPTVLCELGLFYLIIKNAKNKWWNLLLATLWLFNPYFIARFNYTLYDPIFLLTLVLAIEANRKNQPFLSGIFLALSVSLKTIPLILLPTLFFMQKDKKKFVLGFALLFVAIMLPFARSVTDLTYVINGSLFVHGNRVLQGRPLLYFIEFYTGIPTFQNSLLSLYAVGSLLIGTIVPLVMYYKYKLDNLYLLTFSSMFAYILVTPVLSRTHLLWPFIFFLMYAKHLEFKTKIVIVTAIFWFSTFVYLLFWQNGFTTDENTSIPHLDRDEIEWNLVTTGKRKYYEYRSIFLQ